MAWKIEKAGDGTQIIAAGKDFKQAFADGARAVFHLLQDTDRIRGEERVHFAVDSGDLEGLYRRWLEELLAQQETRGFLFADFSITSFQKVNAKQYLVTGAAYGEPFDPKRHIRHAAHFTIRENGLSCSEKNGEYTCSVIVDLTAA